MSNPNSEQFYSQRFVDHLEYSKDSPFVPCIISTALSLPPPGDHLPTHNHTHMSPTGISSHIAYKHADLFSIDLHLEEGAAQDGGFPFITRIFSYTCSTRGPWPCNTHAIRPQHLFPALVNGEERGGRIAFLVRVVLRFSSLQLFLVSQRNAYKHSHNVHPKDRKMLHTIIPCVHLLLSIGIALSTSMNLSCHRAGVIQ